MRLTRCRCLEYILCCIQKKLGCSAEHVQLYKYLHVYTTMHQTLVAQVCDIWVPRCYRLHGTVLVFALKFGYWPENSSSGKQSMSKCKKKKQ
jgi:hypothetical protein